MSIQAVQATTRRLGLLVTHRLFVKDDIKYGQLIELGEPVINPHQQLYFVCPPHKLKLNRFICCDLGYNNHSTIRNFC